MQLEDFQVYMANKDNGLLKVIEISAGVLSLQYVPAEILVNQEISNARPGQYADSEIDSLFNSFRQNIYFKVVISKNGESIESFYRSDPEKASMVREHLLNSISQDFKLTAVSKEPLALLGHTYVAGPPGGSYSTIILVFRRNEAHGDLELKYRDRLLGFGYQVFRIRANDIKAMPTLSLK